MKKCIWLEKSISTCTVKITQYALKGQRGRVISSDNGSRGRAKIPQVPKCPQERNPARHPGG